MANNQSNMFFEICSKSYDHEWASHAFGQVALFVELFDLLLEVDSRNGTSYVERFYQTGFLAGGKKGSKTHTETANRILQMTPISRMISERAADTEKMLTHTCCGLVIAVNNRARAEEVGRGFLESLFHDGIHGYSLLHQGHLDVDGLGNQTLVIVDSSVYSAVQINGAGEPSTSAVSPSGKAFHWRWQPVLSINGVVQTGMSVRSSYDLLVRSCFGMMGKESLIIYTRTTKPNGFAIMLTFNPKNGEITITDKRVETVGASSSTDRRWRISNFSFPETITNRRINSAEAVYHIFVMHLENAYVYMRGNPNDTPDTPQMKQLEAIYPLILKMGKIMSRMSLERISYYKNGKNANK